MRSQRLALAHLVFVSAASAIGAQMPPAVPIDLALTRSGRFTVDVEPGQWLSLTLVNRAPAASYQVTLQGLPPYTVGPPSESIGRRLSAGPECEPAQDALQSLLRISDEAAVEKALRAVTDTAPACARLSHIPSSAQDVALPRASFGKQLRLGETLEGRITRLGPGGAVARTWEFTLRAGSPNEALRYPSEEAWIVSMTVDRLIELASLGQGPAPETRVTTRTVANAPRYEVSTAGRPALPPVVIEEHVWSLASYRPLAESLLAKRARSTPAAASDLVTLTALLDLRPSVIRAESQRLSQLLQKQPLDPAAHEQAALTIGAFALRETAGVFSDTRQALSSMAAHLAWAAALRGSAPVGIDGRIAGILVDSLAGRQPAALARLREEAARNPGRAVNSWVRALSVRNSLDWRMLSDTAAVSLLERREHFAAVNRCLGAISALNVQARLHYPPLSDWGRLALTGAFEIEAGNRVAPTALDLELREAGEVLGVAPGPSYEQRIVRAIVAQRDAAGPPASFAVIPSSMWARQFERHIAFVASRVHMFLAQGLGLPAEAQALRDHLAPLLAPLETLPALQLDFVRVSSAGSPTPASGPQDACKRLVSVLKTTPWRATPWVWSLPARFCPGTTLPSIAWFEPVVVRGTGYEAATRLSIAVSPERQEAIATALRAQAVHDPEFIESDLKRRLGNREPSVGEITQAYGALAEYHAGAIRRLLGAERDETKRIALRQRLCAADDATCFELGDELAFLDRDEDARKAYELGVAKSSDLVALSNSVDWLVDYYFEHGMQDAAERIATQAAAVGSQSGMEVLAHLRERQGRLAEAAERYREIDQRYPDNKLVLRFRIRQARRNPAKADPKQADADMRTLFPRGLERTDKLAGFPFVLVIQPQDIGKNLRRFGIRPGEQIVALDGYLVANWDQYRCILGFDDSRTATLTVLRAGGPREVSGRYLKPRYGPEPDRPLR